MKNHKHICTYCASHKGDKKKKDASRCKYCGEYYCNEHRKPKFPSIPLFESVGKEAEEIMENYHSAGGHPCFPYFFSEDEKKQNQKSKETDDYLEALDSLKNQSRNIFTPIKKVTESFEDEFENKGNNFQINLSNPRKSVNQPNRLSERKKPRLSKFILENKFTLSIVLFFLVLVFLFWMGFFDDYLAGHPQLGGLTNNSLESREITSYGFDKINLLRISSRVTKLNFNLKSYNLAVGLSKHFYNLNKYSLSDSELLGFEGKYNIDDFRYISKKFEGLTKDSMDSVISEWETKPFIFELILGGSFNDGAFGCYLDVCTIVLKSTPVVPAETYKPVITLPKNENVKEDNKNIYEEIKGLLSKDSEKYQTNPKTVKLSLIGDFIVYRGVNDYLAGLDRSISYYYTPPTSKDFILRDLDNKVQKDYLNLLVDKIKAKSDDPDQQARTAISMVQAIPYDWDAFNSGNVDGRYPYEVLYDMKGVCMEKADLLAFLLRELGYGVAIFEYNAENHRAVGIQCEKGNYNTQYCFIEATNSYPIGQIPEGYVGGADIRNANPEVVVISGGRTYLLRLASN